MITELNEWQKAKRAAIQGVPSADLSTAPPTFQSTWHTNHPVMGAGRPRVFSFNRSTDWEWSEPHHTAESTEEQPAPTSNIRIPTEAAKASLQCCSSPKDQVQVQGDTVGAAAMIHHLWVLIKSECFRFGASDWLVFTKLNGGDTAVKY